MPDKNQKKKKPINLPDPDKKTTSGDLGPLPEESKSDKNQDEFFKKLELHFPKKDFPIRKESDQKPVQKKSKEEIQFGDDKVKAALKELSDLTKPNYKKDFDKIDKQKQDLVPLENFKKTDVKPSVDKFSEADEEKEIVLVPKPIEKKSEKKTEEKSEKKTEKDPEKKPKEKENKLPSEKELEEVLAEKKAERKTVAEFLKKKETKKIIDPVKVKKKAQILKDLDKEPEPVPKGKDLIPELDSLGDRKAKRDELKKHIIAGQFGSDESQFENQPESQSELAKDLFDHEKPKVKYRKGESNTLNMIIIGSIIAAVFILGVISFLLL